MAVSVEGEFGMGRVVSRSQLYGSFFVPFV